ncbi:hypothetical protein BU14_0832s0003, partial [Porphyra umbilicalis]
AAWARRHNRTPEGRALLATVAANGAIFAAWQLAPPVAMSRHFILTAAAVTSPRARGHTLVTSFFSHASALHFAGNMYALAAFAPPFFAHLPAAVGGVGAFGVVYGGGGVAAALASLAASAARRRSTPSLGASGAVLALVYALVAAAPDLPVAILGAYPSTLGEVAVALAVVNGVGVLAGWRRVDWAAHVGGSAWGAALCLSAAMPDGADRALPPGS